MGEKADRFDLARRRKEKSDCVDYLSVVNNRRAVVRQEQANEPGCRRTNQQGLKGQIDRGGVHKKSDKGRYLFAYLYEEEWLEKRMHLQRIHKSSRGALSNMSQSWYGKAQSSNNHIEELMFQKMLFSFSTKNDNNSVSELCFVKNTTNGKMCKHIKHKTLPMKAASKAKNTPNEMRWMQLKESVVPSGLTHKWLL
ncbi:hypothetical protein E3N88_36286 [Mikania micrantha]|uniref:Uncharacterized protein n=1 Tax=Mikania micrantha TaxID=192012 RepID=A0A5N6M4B6_9ASTR|nr:hypothetical protein E3N88_36286 [Mikania micrantha]